MTGDEIDAKMRAVIVTAVERHFGYTPSPEAVERLLAASTRWTHDHLRAQLKAMHEERASS